MTTMLEKMADRIAEAFAAQGGGYAADTDWAEIARAALQAIRDLDSGDINDGGLAALVAGKRALYSCSADPELQDARGCFHAMIDAMLNDAHAKPAVDARL